MTAVMPSLPSASQLQNYAQSLLLAAGLEQDKASVVAQVLVEGDLLGHDTHGLAQLPAYLKEIVEGRMRASGEPIVLSQRAAVATWDGQRLPGCWLTQRAIDWCLPRAKEFGIASVAIQRSHHIACLAAYLEAPARAGYMVEIYSSDANSASVAPFGGTTAVFTPNPMAIGIPSGSDPIMLDISASITTNAMTSRLAASGQPAPNAWWMDSQGNPTKDASVLNHKPPGTLLPVGGMDAGHKGYSLALMVEALTAGLSGRGRADDKEGWGATVTVRVSDVSAFSGQAAFNRQVDWLIDACNNNPPRDAQQPVRLPGHRGLARKREQLQSGVQLHPSILPALKPWADQFKVAQVG